jgi:hypothetical protein
MVGAQITRQAADVIQILMQTRNVGSQNAGLTRRDQATAHTVEQSKAQLHFCSRQHFAGRWLRDMQQLRGLRQRAATANRIKNFYMPPPHRLALLLRAGLKTTYYPATWPDIKRVSPHGLLGIL